MGDFILHQAQHLCYASLLVKGFKNGMEIIITLFFHTHGCKSYSKVISTSLWQDDSAILGACKHPSRWAIIFTLQILERQDSTNCKDTRNSLEICHRQCEGKIDHDVTEFKIRCSLLVKQLGLLKPVTGTTSLCTNLH